MDPPYSNKKNDEIIEIIRKQNVLSEKHILILHVEKIRILTYIINLILSIRGLTAGLNFYL